MFEADKTRESRKYVVFSGTENKCNKNENEEGRRSDRQEYRYESFRHSDHKKMFIICNEDKKVKGSLLM